MRKIIVALALLLALPAVVLAEEPTTYTAAAYNTLTGRRAVVADVGATYPEDATLAALVPANPPGACYDILVVQGGVDLLPKSIAGMAIPDPRYPDVITAFFACAPEKHAAPPRTSIAPPMPDTSIAP